MKNFNFTTHRKLRKALVSVFLLAGIFMGNAQNITFADANFENALLNHFPVIDTNRDGIISTAEAEAFTGTLDVSYKDIADIGELSYFTNITRLNCSGNSLTSIDVSHNPDLESLVCSFNNLTSIDVSHNPALELLYCYENNLTSLDVSKNPLLVSLYCYANNLTSLDVSHNPNLAYLSFYENGLTSIDVSHNPDLIYLDCRSNNLMSLDVSNNPALASLYCTDNNLTSLNLANGNNAVLTTMWANGNDLSCIRIDSGFTPPTGWRKDPATEYSADCILAVKDYQIQAVSVYPNPAQDRVFFQSAEAIQKITLYDFSGSKIKEFSPNSSKAEINVSGLSSGIYLAEIQTAKGSRTEKVVKK